MRRMLKHLASARTGLAAAAVILLGMALAPTTASAQSLTDLLGDITVLQLGEDAQNERITVLETQTTTNTTDIMNLRTDTTRNTTDISELRTDTTINTRDISALRTISEMHTSQITDLRVSDARQDTVLATHTTQIAALEAHDVQQDNRLSNVEHQIEGINDRIDTANSGVAMAFALKTPSIDSNKNFAVSGGWGTFEGENAFAVSGAVRATSNLQLDAGIAVGTGSAVGGRAGATMSW